MKKFLVLFLTPVSVIEGWMKTDEKERKVLEEKMRTDWNAWMKQNSLSFVDSPAGAGKTKIVEKNGIKDTKNNVMMYATVEADSHEDASKLFVTHPHLEIPESTIEVMEVNPIY
jgi:hypothetical protein